MRFFRRKSMKSGYANISEPVSDLDPARISAIKARHSNLVKSQSSISVQNTAIEKHRSTPSKSSNDDTFVTENITLDTSPSAVALSSSGSSSKSSSDNNKKPLPDLQENSTTCRAETVSEVHTAPLPSSSVVVGSDEGEDVNTAEEGDGADFTTSNFMSPKTPDTFFGGKNRKRIPIKMDTTSQAPTEHPIATTARGDKGGTMEEEVVVQVPVDTTKTSRSTPRNKKNQHSNNNNSNNKNKGILDDDQSESSDLDKTFSPQIISVNSDITDPSYGLSNRRKKSSSASGGSNQQPSWKKLRKLRRYLQETMNSKTTCSTSGRSDREKKNPLSFLDSVIDAVCTHPSGTKTSP